MPLGPTLPLGGGNSVAGFGRHRSSGSPGSLGGKRRWNVTAAFSHALFDIGYSLINPITLRLVSEQGSL